MAAASFFNNLNPLKNSRKNNQHQGIDAKERANNYLLRFGLPIVGIHGDDKEGNVHGDKHGDRAPPRIYPDESGRFGQKYLKDGEKGRGAQRDKETVVDAQYFLFRFGIEQLAVD